MSVAGPKPVKYVTKRIAGRKTIRPRSETDVSQSSSKSRTEKLITKAASAMAKRHAAVGECLRKYNAILEFCATAQIRREPSVS